MQFENTQLIVTFMTMAAIGLFSWALYKVSKANPSMGLGELITYIILKRSWDGFMVAGLLIMIFQAIAASSIQRIDEPEINPLLRSLGHIVIAFVGLVGNINVPISLYRIVIAFQNKRPASVVISKFVQLFSYIALAFGAPLLNLYSVASACGQHEQLQLLLMEWTNSADYCRDYYIGVGLPDNYSPWTNMYSILQLDIMITLLFHPLVVFMDGVNVFASGGSTILDLAAEKKAEKTLDGKEKKDIKNKVKDDLSDVKDPLAEKAKTEAKANKEMDNADFANTLSELLEFYGGQFKSEDRRKAKSKSLTDLTYGKYTTDNNKTALEALLSNIMTLRTDVALLKSRKNPSEGDRKAMIQRIQAAFKKRPSEGGFGEDLPFPK
jgi:hypothetical protein